jgi:hypothetical protein
MSTQKKHWPNCSLRGKVGAYVIFTFTVTWYQYSLYSQHSSEYGCLFQDTVGSLDDKTEEYNVD